MSTSFMGWIGFGQVMRGYWIHTDREGRRHAVGRCQTANVYISYQSKFGGHRRERGPKQIDTRCRGCGKRVRFNPSRRVDSQWGTYENRGSISNVHWVRADSKSRKELERIVAHLNSEKAERQRKKYGETFRRGGS